MFDHYEWFKKEVYRLTQIDLNYYKEKQMRRRIDTLARKNGADSYETYIEMISTDKAKFKQFINFITALLSGSVIVFLIKSAFSNINLSRFLHRYA